LNGAAARKAHVGDHLIICTYGQVGNDEISNHAPKIVLLDDGNTIKEIKKII
jgi:aspartate 1-decarboxylase